MKKTWVVIIIALSLTGFGAAVFFGIRVARGVPVADEVKVPHRVVAQLIDREIDLSEGIDVEFWDTLEPQQIDLQYQVMILPWPKEVVPFVNIKSFHNGRRIYFYLQWQDEVEDADININRFSDACAVMFPLGDDVPASTLLMGFMGNANIWHWKANRGREYWTGIRTEDKAYVDFYYPFENEELFVVSKDRIESAATDLVSARIATVTVKPIQSVEARGAYENGIWRVVFRRTLEVMDAEIDAQFTESVIQCAFAIWDGAHKDRGGRKSISDWVELVMR